MISHSSISSEIKWRLYLHSDSDRVETTVPLLLKVRRLQEPRPAISHIQQQMNDGKWKSRVSSDWMWGPQQYLSLSLLHSGWLTKWLWVGKKRSGNTAECIRCPIPNPEKKQNGRRRRSEMYLHSICTSACCSWTQPLQKNKCQSADRVWWRLNFL